MEQAREAACETGKLILAILQQAAGTLDRIEIVKVTGYVASTPEFSQHAKKRSASRTGVRLISSHSASCPSLKILPGTSSLSELDWELHTLLVERCTNNYIKSIIASNDSNLRRYQALSIFREQSRSRALWSSQSLPSRLTRRMS